jgi:hypothetical protein
MYVIISLILMLLEFLKTQWLIYKLCAEESTMFK